MQTSNNTYANGYKVAKPKNEDLGIFIFVMELIKDIFFCLYFCYDMIDH